MMKNIRCLNNALIVCFLFALIFVGCDKPEYQYITNRQKVHKVAILLASDMYLPLSAEGLQEGMKELGYSEGENVEYTIYNAHGDKNKLKELAKEIVDSQPDVICPSIITAINAVKDTGTELPVVFLESMYPVEFGLAENLTNPGSNFTGVSNMTGPMSGKRLELLKELVPKIKVVAVICNPANQVAHLSLKETEKAAALLGLQLQTFLVNTAEEVDEAIDAIARSKIDALVLNPDFMVFSRLDRIISMTMQKKIPTMGIDPSQVEAGILASYGGGLKQIARQAASHVDKILQGESAAVLPIEAPYQYNFYVNMKTAAAIGVNLPPEKLYQASGYFR